MNQLETRQINGFKIHIGAREELVRYALNRKGILVALNAQKLYAKDKTVVDLCESEIGYPDGIGAVLACKRKGATDVVKIPGCELWLNIIEAIQGQRSVFIVGSTQEVIEKTIMKLQAEYPKLDIIGYRNGFLDDASRHKLGLDIARLRPAVVFVAQGSPRQEHLMQELLEIHPAVYMGLGGSLDVFVGNKTRAPLLFQRLGLEWAYRSLIEPKRLRRQLVLIPFLLRLVLNKM